MSLFSGPVEHADNPPATWGVVKRGARYALVTKDGGVLTTCERKRDAVELLTSGFFFNLYAKESRWYAGEAVDGWRSSNGR